MSKQTKVIRILLVLLVVATLAFVFVAIVDYAVLQTILGGEQLFHALMGMSTDPSLLGSCTASTVCIVGS